MRNRILIIIALVIAICLAGASLCEAKSQAKRREWAFGWQAFRPSSGLTVKCPIQDNYYLQPIFVVAINDEATSNETGYAYGLRGVYLLPPQTEFQPYVGCGIGHHYRSNVSTSPLRPDGTGGTGYELFFGVEYRKNLLRPALEVGLGGLHQNDGGFRAGVTYNFSILYYF